MQTPTTKLIGLLLSLTIGCNYAWAERVTLNPNHPQSYVVVKGDTLWDIAGRFLNHPWYWPNVWHANPQIENPHLIYPGDEISLSYVEGEPRLTLHRGASGGIGPKIRTSPIEEAIPTIPINAVHQFLTHPYVVEEGELDDAPYVIQIVGEHLIGGAGNEIYVRALSDDGTDRYAIVRQGKPYRDADTQEILGYEAQYIGEARLEQSGDPAKLYLVKTDLEVITGDRLLPTQAGHPLQNFHPKPPEFDVQGSIISVLNGVSQIGQYNVVVIDRGEEDGIAHGHVLAIYQRGKTVRDTVTPDLRDTVTLPDEHAGTLLIFRVFPRISFGLVMRATDALHVLDRVRTP